MQLYKHKDDIFREDDMEKFFTEVNEQESDSEIIFFRWRGEREVN